MSKHEDYPKTLSAKELTERFRLIARICDIYIKQRIPGATEGMTMPPSTIKALEQLNPKLELLEDHVFINNFLLGRIFYESGKALHDGKYYIRHKNTTTVEGIQFSFTNQISLEEFISDLCDECDNYFLVLEKILFELQ